MKAVLYDKRAFPRYRVSMTVLVQRVFDHGFAGSERDQARRSPTVSVTVTNISLSGLVFIASHPHPPGALVQIQLGLGAKVFNVRAVIKRTQVLALPGHRSFRCAAQFVRGEGVTEFIPAVAKYLQKRYGSSGAYPS